jgi:hypothetical protein
MLPQKVIITLCCVFGAALPLSVMAQISPPGGGMSPPGGGMSTPTTPTMPGSTASPTDEPTGLSSPTTSPTSEPTGLSSPTASPTTSPTDEPTGLSSPTASPTTSPTDEPTGLTSPSPSPTMSPSQKPKTPSKKKSTPQSQSQPVNINTATVQDLVKVKGIGSPTAQKIVAARPFTSLDELVAKKIVTSQQLKAMKSQLTY